ALPHTLGELGGPVRRAVVDDQRAHLAVDHRRQRVQHAAQHRLDRARLFVGGDDDPDGPRDRSSHRTRWRWWWAATFAALCQPNRLWPVRMRITNAVTAGTSMRTVRLGASAARGSASARYHG